MSAELIDQELYEIFGVDLDVIDEDRGDGTKMPMAYFNRIVKFIDDSGAICHLEEWRDEHRKSKAGRRAQVPIRAAVVALTLNLHWGRGAGIQQLGTTLNTRLTYEQKQLLGITVFGGSKKQWYHRGWRSLQRALHPVDPWHRTGRRKKLTAAELKIAKKAIDEVRKDRAHFLMDLLVHASAAALPQKYLSDYQGDVALDATLLKVRGKASSTNDEKKRVNIEFTAGRYGRGGDHTGAGLKTDEFGNELETAVMIDTKNGAFPFPLITGAYLHIPGDITIAGSAAFLQHAKFSPKKGNLVVDRAYNNLTAEHFQRPVRDAGYWTVFDYPAPNRGFQGRVDDHPLIQVDGSIYVDSMPKHLWDFTKLWAFRKPNPATGKQYTVKELSTLLAEREQYRLKYYGRPSEGKQRFSYPDPAGYVGIDHVNGGGVQKNKPSGTVSFELSDHILRNLQRHPWGSAAWRRAYGQRNHVENSNKLIKDENGVELGNKKKRTGRGFAYQNLAAALGVFAENLRRIVTGIVSVHSPKPKAKEPMDAEKAEELFWKAPHRIPRSVRIKLREAAAPPS